MLRKGLDFSKESVEKSWGKESADESGSKNSDCETGSQSDNTVDSPQGFIIHGIEVFEGNEEVTEVIDVENWRIDNSRVLRWVVFLIKWNAYVPSMKSSIQSTSGSGNGSTSSELEARVCIQGRNYLGQFSRKLYGDF
ncbi:hypothetical protein Tco_0368294 [Tanacetum coccineum]